MFFVMMGMIGFLASLFLFCVVDRDKKILDGTWEDKKVYTVKCNTSLSDD